MAQGLYAPVAQGIVPFGEFVESKRKAVCEDIDQLVCQPIHLTLGGGRASSGGRGGHTNPGNGGRGGQTNPGQLLALQ